MTDGHAGAAGSRTAMALRIVGAWAVVAIPLLWGVVHVAVQSLALFR